MPSCRGPAEQPQFEIGSKPTKFSTNPRDIADSYLPLCAPCDARPSLLCQHRNRAIPRLPPSWDPLPFILGCSVFGRDPALRRVASPSQSSILRFLPRTCP
ncbi:hypothetical protein FALCPG4_006744 [Fusarium falciforme]